MEETNSVKRIPIANSVPYRELKLHHDFRELLSYIADEYGDDSAYIIKTKRETKTTPAEYKRVSFIGLKRDVEDFGTALMNMGLKGQRFAIIGKNRYEWMVGYYAWLCGLGICVPLDRGLPYDELEMSIIRSKSDILFFDKDHLETVEALKAAGTTQLTTYICMDKIEGYLNVPDIMAKGRVASQEDKETYRKLPIDSDGMTILLFTSGTSGLAKAVMLSQASICHNCWSVLSVEDLRHGDVNMAFLPYHHTFGSTGQTMMSCAGMTTVFCDGLKYVQKNMVEYGVSVFICVPLLIEGMYKKVMQAVKKQGKEKTLRTGIKISRLLLKLGIDIRRKLFNEIHEQLGGHLRYIVSGASALDPVVNQGWLDLGVKLVQGYGMTETSPVMLAETPEVLSLGSNGIAIPGVTMAIEDPNEEGIGELVCKGPNVMLGYYENEEATAEIMRGGWLHTGDLASLDKNGCVVIRGRSKNVIVLKNGKNIYPEELETVIGNLPYVKENMVYGQARHKDGDSGDLSLCVRIVYDPEYVESVLGIKLGEEGSPEREAALEELEKLVSADLDKINAELPVYKQILRHELTDKEMEKTTTGKVKRYKQVI